MGYKSVIGIIVFLLILVVIFMPNTLNQIIKNAQKYLTYILNNASKNLFSNTTKISKNPFSNAKNISALFMAAQSLYNSTNAFNMTYNVYLNFSHFPIPNYLVSNTIGNGTLQIAKYNNAFRVYSTFSFHFPQSLNLPFLVKEEVLYIYNGLSLVQCNKTTVINESPVNSSIESQIKSFNSAPMKCTSTLLVFPSFYVAHLYVAAPFTMLYPIQQVDSLNLENSNGNVSSLGYRSYLGQSCLMERLIPSSIGTPVPSINDCISLSNGLPLYSDWKVNSSVVSESNISAINAAPSNANVITSLPLNAILT